MTSPAGSAEHTNRLAQETSPYLLQHAHNPVDWYAWGPEALERARREDRPILLSIGYSACHWCHVMERESFESVAIAEQMNRDFVCIKVDREERPDLDQIYQLACQLMSQRAGGWPLTMFLLPDGRPFFGGTYFPPEDRHGMPGFPRILASVADAYQKRRPELERGADEATRVIESISTRRPPPAEPSAAGLAMAVNKLQGRFDRGRGGFGDRPKFPNTMATSLLLRHHEATNDPQSLEMYKLALVGMMEGGIYDHLGGGFHRYSTDERWLVPHFEKMLYDNALLVPLYLDGWRATQIEPFERIARETLAYVRREMTSPAGAFYATQDADSEGEEGKFFVWTPAEIQAVLGDRDGLAFCLAYGVSPEGNFHPDGWGAAPDHTGATVLHANRPLSAVAGRDGRSAEELPAVLAAARQKLFQAREQRIKPFRDEKIIASWNGLMISAFADGYACLGDPHDLGSAVAAAHFIEEQMMKGDTLLRVFKDGHLKIEGFAEDYAFVAKGMLDLYEAGFDPHHLALARRLTDALLARFWDDATGGLYFTSATAEKVVTRPVDSHDNAIPSATSVTAHLLQHLAAITGHERYGQVADRLIRTTFAAAVDNPFGYSHLLGAADLLVRGAVEVALVGDPSEPELVALARAAARLPALNRVTYLVDEANDPLGRKRVAGKPAAYVCRGRSCSPPVTDPAALSMGTGT